MSIIRREHAQKNTSKKIIPNLFGYDDNDQTHPKASHSIVSSPLIKGQTIDKGETLQLKPLKNFKSDEQKTIIPEEVDQLTLDVSIPIATNTASTTQEQPAPKPPHPPLPTREEILSELNSFKEEQLKLQKQTIDAEITTYRHEREKQIEEELQQKREAAYREGYEAGILEGENKLKGLATEAISTINGLAQERHSLLQHSEKESLALGFAIAEKVIQTQLDHDSSVFQNILHEAIRGITDKEKVIIKVNKKDIELVRKFQETFSRELSDIKSLEIQEDKAIEFGGCVIETKLGFIDSSISTKLDIIRRAFDTILKEESELETEPSSLQDTIPSDDDLNGLDPDFL